MPEDKNSVAELLSLSHEENSLPQPLPAFKKQAQ